MQRRQRCLLLLLLVASSSFFWSCRARNQTAKQSEPATPAASPVKDGGPIVSETIGHFRAQTYSATVNISKVYRNGLRYDDLLHIYSKLDQQDRIRVLISVKPQGERKGTGMLAEIQNNQMVSGYRFIPESKSVVPVSGSQRFSNVVLGGLSLQDFQLVQGVAPFSEMRLAGREEINGKQCDAIEVVFIDQSQYHHGKLFTTVGERLPVLMQAFDKDGALLKEIVFDELKQIGKTWVVNRLRVLDKSFKYESTFTFADVRLNSRLDDSVFTPEFLQKGWQEAGEKSR